MSDQLQELVPETGSPENGHGRTAPSTPPRLEILPSGVRIVRLGPGEAGWFTEYRSILRLAAEDFLRRARAPGVPERLIARLADAIDDPAQGVWLVLDPAYRLIGFGWAQLTSPYGGPLVAFCPAIYLYPKKRAVGVFTTLVRRMCAWAHAQGADRAYFETRRGRPLAWHAIGATPYSAVYELETRDPAEGA